MYYKIVFFLLKEANLLGLKGPRKMVVIIPGITVDERFNRLRPVAVRPISVFSIKLCKIKI